MTQSNPASNSSIKPVQEAFSKLASMKPDDKQFLAAVKDFVAKVQALSAAPKPRTPEGKTASQDEVSNQIRKLYEAAEIPARNYKRMASILVGLHKAHTVSLRPGNAAVRPRIASLVEKVAGLFAEVDTVQDLDKPLEAIEKAIHGLYGDQSKNSTFYLDRRGKGHHSE